MSHRQQVEFFTNVYNKFQNYFDDKKILEVGSLNINGSLRDIFKKPSEYIGCDLAPGSGVDIISRAHELKYEKDYFDVSLSAECFEHDEFWVQSFAKMVELTKSGGIIVFSCATEGRPEHGTSRTDRGSSPFTNDYYRNLTQENFEKEFDLKKIFKEYEFSVDSGHHDLYFWGLL